MHFWGTSTAFTAPPSDPPALSSSRLKHPGALINIYNDLNNSSNQQQPWPASNGEPFANTNSAIGPPPQPPSHPAPPQQASNSVPTLSVNQGNGAFSGDASAHNRSLFAAGPQAPPAQQATVHNPLSGLPTHLVPHHQLPSQYHAGRSQPVNYHPNTPDLGGANTNLSPPPQDAHGRGMFSSGSAASGSQPATPHLAAPIGQYPQFSAYRNGQGVVPSPAPSPLASISGGLSPAPTSPGAPSPGGVSPLATSLGLFLNLAQAHDVAVNGPISGQQSGEPSQVPPAGGPSILTAQYGRDDCRIQVESRATTEKSSAKRKFSLVHKTAPVVKETPPDVKEKLPALTSQKKWLNNLQAQYTAVRQIFKHLEDSQLNLSNLFGTENALILSTLFPTTDGAKNDCRFTVLTRLLVEYIENGKVEKQPEQTRDHFVPLLAAFVGDPERSNHLYALENRLHKEITAKSRWAEDLRDAGTTSSSSPVPALPCLPLSLRALSNRNMLQLQYYAEHHTGLKVAIQTHLHRQKNPEHQGNESPSNSNTAPAPDFVDSFVETYMTF
ncbi:hypothetical protein OC846_003591 [Tilletia horrida]|uniref:Uncharacterized protein n=1 Tax=Tilletia horrida TaxID=155126 RepID=A0AAN6GRR6_9BASI|nr:hypothetical protein OC846_003591 [Tilletia horrida]